MSISNFFWLYREDIDLETSLTSYLPKKDV